MQLTPEQQQIGKDNFNEAVSVTRRSFLKGAAAAGVGLGAVAFGYEKLKGSPVKTAFIGTGDEGSILLTQHPADYMDIVAVADLRPTNRVRALHGDGNEHRVGLIKKLGRKTALGIKLYADHLELLKNHPEVEVVVVAVPLCQHARVAIDCMRAGKHVLTEKLMAHDVTQCKEMIKVAREENRLLAVGHQRHYNVLYANANDLVRKGLLGDIKFIRAQWHRNNSFPGRDSWQKDIPGEDAAALKTERLQQFGYPSLNKLVNWRLYYETGGGLMAELGSHQLDAASIFLGKVHPLAVQGYGGKNFYGVKGIGTPAQQADDRDIDDHVYTTFEFPGPHYAEDPNDVCIVTYSSISTNRMEPYGETVFGSRGTLIMKQELETMLYKEGSAASGPGGPDQRLYVLYGDDGKPVLDASDSLAPSTQAATADTGEVSRGYTEEMEHFCHAVRTQGPNYYPDGKMLPADQGGLLCPGVQGMADAVMALTSNLAMKHKKRIQFKDAWFDPEDPAVPETDPEIVG